MSDFTDPQPGRQTDLPAPARGSRMSIPEIAHRLAIGRQAVYEMLEQGILPGIRLGRRWIVTRNAYEKWEATCGTKASTRESAGQSDFTSVPDRGRSVLCQ